MFIRASQERYCGFCFGLFSRLLRLNFKFFSQSHRMKLINRNNNHCFTHVTPSPGETRVSLSSLSPWALENPSLHSAKHKNTLKLTPILYSKQDLPRTICRVGQERSGERAAASLPWAVTARRYSSRCKLGRKEPVKDPESHSPESRYAVYSRLVSTV